MYGGRHGAAESGEEANPALGAEPIVACAPSTLVVGRHRRGVATVRVAHLLALWRTGPVVRYRAQVCLAEMRVHLSWGVREASGKGPVLGSPWFPEQRLSLFQTRDEKKLSRTRRPQRQQSMGVVEAA
jgi:hypothetical protein